GRHDSPVDPAPLVYRRYTLGPKSEIGESIKASHLNLIPVFQGFQKGESRNGIIGTHVRSAGYEDRGVAAASVLSDLAISQGKVGHRTSRHRRSAGTDTRQGTAGEILGTGAGLRAADRRNRGTRPCRYRRPARHEAHTRRRAA